MNVAGKVLGTIWEKLSGSQVFWYLVLAVLAYVGYKRLTKPKEETFLDTPLPNGGTQIPTSWNPNNLVQTFHEYFDSYFTSGDVLYKGYVEANSLTNDQFVFFVKTYNAKYAKADGSTLWKRVNSWRSLWYSGSDGLTQQKTFIARMVKFKLDY